MNLLLLPPETMTFIVVIVIFWAYIHFAAFNARTAAQAPTLFTTFGIFATFFGIALGLLHFDAKNIQASVPALLDGLRTAFWASVFGVGAALTVKLRVAFFGIPPAKKGETAHPQGATIDDLAAHLISVRQALVGSDDSTLITQITYVLCIIVFRLNINDKHIFYSYICYDYTLCGSAIRGIRLSSRLW